MTESSNVPMSRPYSSQMGQSARPQPAWLVLSSDVDQNSAATIGWPLDVGPEPAQTFDVPDFLLLDGLPAAFQREQERRSRVRWLTGSAICP